MIQSKANKTNDHEIQIQNITQNIQSNKYKNTKSVTCIL